MNAVIPHYRTLSLHLEKGPPVLAGGGDTNFVRVRWGREASPGNKWYGQGV